MIWSFLLLVGAVLLALLADSYIGLSAMLSGTPATKKAAV